MLVKLSIKSGNICSDDVHGTNIESSFIINLVKNNYKLSLISLPRGLSTSCNNGFKYA